MRQLPTASLSVPWSPIPGIDDADNNGVGRFRLLLFRQLARRRSMSALDVCGCWPLPMQVPLQTFLVTGVYGEGCGDGIATVTITASDSHLLFPSS